MHAIHWFEIPTADLARATAFYSEVLGTSGFTPWAEGAVAMTLFPYDHAANGVGGALVQRGDMRPAAGGVVIYLDAGQDLAGAVERAVRAGGQVTQPVTDIGDPGYIALVRDRDGNVVGLHQPRAAAQP